jgi:hypothetical protein
MMDENWRLVLIAAITHAPEIVAAIAALTAAVFSGINTWHTIKARKEMNGMKHELVQAVTGQAKAEGILEGKDIAQAHQDELRGTAEDRKVP